MNVCDDILTSEERRKTASRYRHAMAELLSGYSYDDSLIERGVFEFPDGDVDPDEDLWGADAESFSRNSLVSVIGIEYTSVCQHHLMPFTGVINVAYLPSGGRVIGLSKIARIVWKYSRRLQFQERITKQVASYLGNVVQSPDVGAVSEAVHSCVSCRGVKQMRSSTVTSCLLGEIRSNPVYQRVLFEGISGKKEMSND